MLAPFVLSLKLAATTTSLLFLLCMPLLYWVHLKSGPLRPFFKSLISLPLVLPPTVLGYYLLVSFQSERWLGTIWEGLFGQQLAFSFAGLVLGSMIFSLPFLLNPIISALEGLPDSFTEAAYVMGKSPWQTFWRVLLPNVKQSIIVGGVMAFAHTIGEFGVVLMIGGNIPAETRVASIAIYQEVEALRYDQANIYALSLLLFSFLVLLIVYFGSQHQSDKTFK
ncbi:MAG: molybdate ABC transporter permease subunit [Bacteroidota bacterium]